MFFFILISFFIFVDCVQRFEQNSKPTFSKLKVQNENLKSKSFLSSTYIPTAQDYQIVYYMIDTGFLPYKWMGRHHRRSAWELRQLGQQYFPNLPAGQNSTTLAEVLYDWTFSTYRRVQFPLIARSHVDVLCDLINYWSLNRFPKVAWMFNLTGSSHYENCQQLENGKFATAESWGLAEGNLIRYALNLLETKPTYAQYNTLYRGDGRNRKYFCSQFDDVFNIDVDECVAKYFSQPGQTFQVQSFWSSTWINSLHRYIGAVRFYIKPNPDGTQTSWSCANIQPMSSDPTSDECLYPKDSFFTVVSVVCNSQDRVWDITIQEGKGNNTIATPLSNPTIQHCTD